MRRLAAQGRRIPWAYIYKEGEPITCDRTSDSVTNHVSGTNLALGGNPGSNSMIPTDGANPLRG
jgi:hypothetical protein